MFISLLLFLMSINMIFMKNFQLLFIFLLIILYIFLMLTNLQFLSFYISNNNYYYIDFLSLMLIFLLILIVFLMIMASYKKINKFMYSIYFILMQILVLCFIVNNLFLFYIFFEFSLVPLMLLIFYKGSFKERFMSSMYLLMFTMSSSLLFLMLLLMMKMEMFINLNNFYIFNIVKNNTYIFMLVVFLVKFPMYGLHMWLPKAHVESPVEGSMLLAGVLLKLGVFGFYRFLMFIMLSNNIMYSIIMVMSLLGSFFCSLVCLRQIDMKIMIAYSSVSHMSILLSGFLSFSKIGVYGSMMMVMAHGFCSSGLFYLLNFYYESVKSRNIYLLKGVCNFYPLLTLFWLMLCIFNMGTPPSLNFISEIFLAMAILQKSLIFSGLLILFMFFSVTYGLNMYLRLGQGMFLIMNNLKKENNIEMLIVNLHLMFLFVYLFNLNKFLI